MTTELIEIYDDLSKKVWDKMTGMVGVHTVMVLIQRAVWITSQKYGEASGIKFDESGISFAGIVESCDKDELKPLLEEFFGTLVMILTRLVGEDIAKKILKELDNYKV